MSSKGHRHGNRIVGAVASDSEPQLSGGFIATINFHLYMKGEAKDEVNLANYS